MDIYLVGSPLRRTCRLAIALFLSGVAWAGLASSSSAIVYEGRPDLALTAAIVAAGGGPAHFSSSTLYGYLSADRQKAETAKLTKQFGAAAVADTFVVFDYAIDDALRIATANHVSLPTPSPLLMRRKELALSLYDAGLSGSGKWDVGYMLEHMITHPIHHAIMGDIDARFGAKRNARFHIVLTQLMSDLSKAYK